MREVKPALTAEEWERGRVEEGSDWFHNKPSDPDNPHCMRHWSEGSVHASCDNCVVHGHGAYFKERRHALAALALHDQPFGFAWADVDMLREAAEVQWTPEKELLELMDRIAALLPPR